MSTSNETYKRKQVWLERVMASDLTPATKVFAFAIYKHAYGTKVDSFPDTDEIVKDTGLASSKFPTYRRALFASGAVTGQKVRRGKFKQENYIYELNLDWEGHVPTGSEPCTQKVEAVYPEGSSHVPTGDSNTTTNTTKKTTRNTSTDGPVVADAPTSPSSFNYSLKDGFTFESSLNSESKPSVYFADLTGITQSTAVYPEGTRLKDEPVSEPGGINKDYVKACTVDGVLYESPRKAQEVRDRRANYTMEDDW